MKKLHNVLSFYLLSLLLAKSEIVTLTMENNGDFWCGPEWNEFGLKITNGRGTLCLNLPNRSGSSVSNGTSFFNDIAELNIVNIEGDEFSPISIDMAEYSRYFTSNTPIQFRGQKADGEVVTFEVKLDNVADGNGGAEDFETVYFPSEFADIVSLESPNENWSMDNLVVETVVPPSLPINQRLGAYYDDAELIFSERSNLEDKLIIGENFSYGHFWKPNEII